MGTFSFSIVLNFPNSHHQYNYPLGSCQVTADHLSFDCRSSVMWQQITIDGTVITAGISFDEGANTMLNDNHGCSDHTSFRLSNTKFRKGIYIDYLWIWHGPIFTLGLYAAMLLMCFIINITGPVHDSLPLLLPLAHGRWLHISMWQQGQRNAEMGLRIQVSSFTILNRNKLALTFE